MNKWCTLTLFEMIVIYEKTTFILYHVLDLVCFLSSVESWILIESRVNWLSPGKSYLRILLFKLILNHGVRNTLFSSDKINPCFPYHSRCCLESGKAWIT